MNFPRAPFSANVSDAVLLSLRSAVEGDCLVWIGTIDREGYGRVPKGRVESLAHRLAYRVWVGEIPAILELDHLCRNRRCIWPEHLEAVTKRVNILRGMGVGALNARKTHCPQGHPLSGANLAQSTDSRRCLICKRANGRRAQARYQAKRIIEGKGR